MTDQTLFEVWAPEKNRVELVLGDRSYEMTKGERGAWQVRVDAPAGTRYQYRVEGEGPYPDPRSPCQPDGVHGPSMTVDHAAFSWSDQAFVPKPLTEAVFYELHVGTFTPEGTYAAAAERLPHLVELGITHVELLPLASFPGQHGWGYDGAALFAPHAAYGTPDDLKRLVAYAHRLGIAMVLDVVYNHFGPDGAYVGCFGPYLTSHYRTPWGDAVNYDDKHSDGVRRFVLDNALMWLRDYHFDGLRLDAVHAIHDESAVHVLEALASTVAELSEKRGRAYTLVAESDLNAPRVVEPRALGGHGLHAQWADDFHHAIHAYFTKERDGIYADFGSLAHIAKALRQAYVYDGQYSTYRAREFGRAPTRVAPSQLVVFSQNHDQTGNRALGERLGELLETQQAKAVAALVLLSPFVPLLFQGEEWNATAPFLFFSDHGPELGRQVAEGRRKDFELFGWAAGDIPDPQDPDTFLRSKLDWTELERPRHREMLAWYRALLGMRRGHDFGAEPPQVRFDEKARWLTLVRGDALVVLNLAREAQRVPLPDGIWDVHLASDEDATLDSLPAHGTIVARRR